MKNDSKKPFTHHAYIFRNYGPPRRGQTRRPGWWQREGWARMEPNGEFFVFLHSTPLGGFDGPIRCIEFGKLQPPEPSWVLTGDDEGGEVEQEPHRPDDLGDDTEKESED